MNRQSIAAACVTVAAAVLVVVLLMLCRLGVGAMQWPPLPHPATELVEIDEEFVDLFDPSTVHANPSPAYAAEEARHESVPAEAAGSALADAGKAAAPAPDVVSERPSPVARPKKDKPAKTGPDKDAAEQEKARRKARSGVANAFKTTEEPADNTKAKGKEKGDTGTPEGAASDLNGTGSGTVGGGWIMPRYAKVGAHQTGSIELRAIVDSTGKVVSVDLVGGKAPASGDPALVEKCKAEVRRHRFTRSDDNAPERSTAKIIYTFR